MDDLNKLMQEALASCEAWERGAPEREAAAKATRERQRVELAEAQRKDAIRRVSVALPKPLLWLAEGGETASEAVSAATGWVKSGRRGLLLRGGVGAGKTVAAAVAMREAMAASFGSCSWHRPNDFVSGVLHSYDDNAPKIGNVIVVIDDVGRETKADFSEALCSFIDDTDTRFVLTTNLKKEDFRARYDERLIDRLNDCARAVSVRSASMRKKDGGF